MFKIKLKRSDNLFSELHVVHYCMVTGIKIVNTP